MLQSVHAVPESNEHPLNCEQRNIPMRLEGESTELANGEEIRERLDPLDGRRCIGASSRLHRLVPLIVGSLNRSTHGRESLTNVEIHRYRRCNVAHIELLLHFKAIAEQVSLTLENRNHGLPTLSVLATDYKFDIA